MPKSPAVSLAVLVGLLVLAFVLNPSPERHRAQLKDSLGQRNAVAGALGVGSLVGLVSTYHSLGVASYTQVGDRTLSIGAFGFVYVP